MVIEINGFELHWEETGEGEPLLWLHGAMGCGADWRHIFKEPPAGYRVIAPDLRGHGSSTNPSLKSPGTSLTGVTTLIPAASNSFIFASTSANEKPR